MAVVRFQKNSKELLMFQSLCVLSQKFWEPEDTDAYWDALHDAVDAFYKENGETVEAKQFGMALIFYAKEKLRCSR